MYNTYIYNANIWIFIIIYVLLISCYLTGICGIDKDDSKLTFELSRINFL